MIIRLNDIQYRFWLDDKIRTSNEYNYAFSFIITGKLDKFVLEKAISSIMRDFAPFHSVISIVDGYPCFVPTKEFNVPLTVKSSDESVTDSELAVWSDNNAKERLHLNREFPCKFFLFIMPDRILFQTIFHHIIIDGLTMSDFCMRLSQYYNDAINGGQTKQESIDLQAFNEYREQSITETERKQSVEYWKDYLSDAPLHYNVPYDQSLAVETSDKTHFFSLGQTVYGKAGDFVKVNKTTLFRLYSAVWMVVMRYFFQTDDVVLDHTVHLRPKEFDGLLGCFVNNLPMRAKIDGDMPFTSLLSYLREKRAKERLHQNASYTDIISQMRNLRMVTTNEELFNIGIDYPIKDHSFKFDFEGCTSKFFRHSQAAMIGDLCLVIEEGCDLRCSIRYKSAIPSRFIEMLAEGFSLVLAQVLDNPNMAINGLQCISDSCKQRILNLSNGVHNPAIEHSADALQLIHANALSQPAKVALKCNDTTLTYEELEQKSNRLANFINDNVKSKSPIAIAMHRGCDMIVAMLGILKSGRAYLPLDINLPEKRVVGIIRETNVSHIISDSDSRVFDGVTNIVLDDCNDSAESFVCNADINSCAYILYTSGTTGVPKGIPITHHNLRNLIHNERQIFEIDSDSVVLQYANIFFDASVTEIFTSLAFKATLIIADERQQIDPEALAELLERQKVTCATIPPALLPLLPRKGFPLLTTLIVGGESTSPESIAFWSKGRRFINAYGPTENTVDTTTCLMDGNTPSNDIGLPLQGVSTYVLDGNLNILPEYVSGELYIGGEQLTAGYVNNPVINEQFFITNPFYNESMPQNASRLYRSGDMVKRLPNGHLLFLGRKDKQVKLNGQRIELEDIEKNINSICGVEHVYVGIMNVNGETQLSAYVESQTLTDVNAIKSKLRQSLPTYMVPAFITIVSHFPLTANGKIDVAQLPKPLLVDNVNDDNRELSYEALTLKRIICRIMGIDDISVETDLLEFGMSSIQIIQTVFEAEAKGIAVSVSAFYENRTISSILKDDKPRQCFWANDYDPAKPVLLLVCGYPHFWPKYTVFVKALENDFSILVIESFQEYYIGRTDCSANELLEHYVELVKPILKDKELFGVFGYCLGGDLALQLARRLSILGIAHPIAFVHDGFADRGTVPAAGFLIEPGASPDVNAHRNKVSDTIENSFEVKPYDGKVVVTLSTQFSTHHLVNSEDDNTIEDEVSRKIERRFKENPSKWKVLHPECEIHYINVHHLEMIYPEAISVLKEIMLKEIKGS